MARSRRVQLAETSIERLSRVLSDRWHIKVIFQHDRCETTGKIIYLPVLPDDADDSLLAALQGYLDHEAAHCVHTDFEVMEQRLKGKPKLQAAWNHMEDARIERKWVEHYPGARLNLDNSSEWAWKHVAEVTETTVVDPVTNEVTKVKKRTWDKLSDFGKLLYAAGVYNGVGESHWFVKDVVEPDILARVKTDAADLFTQATVAASTSEVIDLAEALLARLNEKDDPAQQPQVIDIDQLPDDVQILPAGALPSPQQQVMFKQPPAHPNAPLVAVVTPSGNVSGSGVKKPRNYNPTPEQLIQDSQATNLSQQLLQEAKRALSESARAYCVYTTEGDKIERMAQGNRAAFSRFIASANSMIGPMKRKLARALLSRQQSHWEEGKYSGKVNSRRLYRLILGTDRDVFKQQVVADDIDTAVLMMVDHSNSMHGKKLELAGKTAAIYGELFEQLKIPFACYGFSTGQYDEAAKRFHAVLASERKHFTRWGNLWLGEYKSFADSWRKTAPALLSMPNNARYNTYDGESLKIGARMLLTRPEKRKILLWFNDGRPCPNDADDQPAHVTYAKLMAKEVEGMVELVCFGITTEAVKDIYSACVIINDLTDLPKQGLTQIDQMLRTTKVRRKKVA